MPAPFPDIETGLPPSCGSNIVTNKAPHSPDSARERALESDRSQQDSLLPRTCSQPLRGTSTSFSGDDNVYREEEEEEEEEEEHESEEIASCPSALNQQSNCTADSTKQATATSETTSEAVSRSTPTTHTDKENIDRPSTPKRPQSPLRRLSNSNSHSTLPSSDSAGLPASSSNPSSQSSDSSQPLSTTQSNRASQQSETTSHSNRTSQTSEPTIDQSQTQLTPQCPPALRFLEPVRPISASEFGQCLNGFIDLKVALLDKNEMYTHIRCLLDLLDYLTDKMPLALSERLFSALAEPPILMTLVDLIQDTSVKARERTTFEAKNEFRYPYIVASILASPKLADACLSHPPFLDKLLSIFEERPAHPIVVTHVVAVLNTYLEYNPSPLLERFVCATRLMSDLTRHLHLAPVVELLGALFPSRLVETAYTMDPASVSFDEALQKALLFLANSQCFHMLAQSFREASSKAVDAYAISEQVGIASEQIGDEVMEEPVEEENVRRALYDAEQTAHNAVEAYRTLVQRTVRIVRIDTRSDMCAYLNTFSGVAAQTLGDMLDAGIKSYENSGGDVVQFLIVAVELASDVLKAAESDDAKRVASVVGQPPSLRTDAVTKEIMERLPDLTLVATKRTPDLNRAARMRMHVLELIGTCQRVCGDDVFVILDKLRYGEVALKMITMHASNSMLHGTVTKAVEAAILTDKATNSSRHHWLVRSRLPEKLIKAWRKERGAELYGLPDGGGIRAPLLSAMAHIACVIHHWIAVSHANTQPGEKTAARALLGDSVADSFTGFFADQLAGVVEAERAPLGGEKPSRPRLPRGIGLRPSSTFSNSWTSSRCRVHLVRSPSAHRFGYCEPKAAPPRNRFADLFDADIDADNDNDFGLGIGSGDAVARIQAAAERLNEASSSATSLTSATGLFDQMDDESGGNGSAGASSSSLLRSRKMVMGAQNVVTPPTESDDLFD